MTLNSVDLPEPLGPIKPTISPLSTSNETSLNAWRPPNSLTTPSTLSTSLSHCARDDALRNHTLRPQDHHHDQQDAVDDLLQRAGNGGWNVEPHHHLLEEREQRRSDDGAGVVPHAAEDHGDQNGDGEVDVEDRGIDVLQVARVDDARAAGEERGEG